MSIPVIMLTPEEVAQVATLRGIIVGIKKQIGYLEQQRDSQQKTLYELLCKVAVVNDRYRAWESGRKNSDYHQSYRYVPTLSEDGHMVVILKESNRE